jgi:hypothetical protein
MEDDEYFYPREDRIPEEEDDSTNNKKKRLRISRHVIAPQEGDEYEMDDDDNHKKSKPIIAIQKIIEDTRKDIEDMFRKERDDIMSQDRFKNLDPDDYDSKKDAISRYLENSKYRQLLDKTTFERINEYKRYQRQLPTIFGFSEKEEPMDPNERHNLWKTPDEMNKTQEEINDLGRKLIAKGKKLSPKFFGELENYSSDEEDNTSSSVNPSNSSSSSSSSLTPSSSPSLASSLSSSPYPLKSILKRKREGGRRTKKAKKSKAKKSKAKKSRSRK